MVYLRKTPFGKTEVRFDDPGSDEWVAVSEHPPGDGPLKLSKEGKVVRGSLPAPSPDEEGSIDPVAENKLLKAQLQAQTERSDFLEDCIAEMATIVYGGV